MPASVRVERVSELPEGQPVIVEPHPDGETIIYVQESQITPQAAAGISSGLTHIKQRYHATGVMHCAVA